MANATAPTRRQYQIGALQIIELPGLPHGRSWTLFRDLDIVGVEAGLPEGARRRALAEALTALVADDADGGEAPGLN
ncbi:hypothetical protein [Geodermatophilus marinus]|uniref:hypothetical protein n=1 Tax=Geodermatophilus sp. LHW52908 TaxID=2303986 RepID=UPI00131501AA|nr:hypothetical protein [Geodermatophilus sp. LHW52908]